MNEKRDVFEREAQVKYSYSSAFILHLSDTSGVLNDVNYTSEYSSE